MCGRYAQTEEMRDLVEHFAVTGSFPEIGLPANWNIAPTNQIYVVRNDASNRRELAIASWGMIAPWLKDESEARISQSRAINARSESVFEKLTFRNAFKSHRCLVPADGYYEWATALGRYKSKQPFYISNKDGSPLAMAGIWSEWKSPTGKVWQTAAIITREAVGKLSSIHSRMPLMLPEDRWESWLDLHLQDSDTARALMDVAHPDAGLYPIPIGTSVNKVGNNGPELIKPIELGESETLF